MYLFHRSQWWQNETFLIFVSRSREQVQTEKGEKVILSDLSWFLVYQATSLGIWYIKYISQNIAGA